MSILGTLLLFQAGATQPALWVGPTVAIALVVVAVACAVMATVAVVVGTRTFRAGRRIEEAADATRGLAVKVQDEVTELVRTSQRLRFEVDRGVRRAKRRLQDLDAVAEVVQEEIEETALDVAATLRTVRVGRGVLGRITRLLRKRR
jgi:type VI protein secretion system component VasK